jgi:hypothetical protein
MNKGLRWTWVFSVKTMVSTSAVIGVLFYNAQGINKMMAVYVLLIAQYEASPLFVRRDSVPLCSTVFSSVLLRAPPPFANSDVTVNTALCQRPLVFQCECKRMLQARATLAVRLLHRACPESFNCALTLARNVYKHAPVDPRYAFTGGQRIHSMYAQMRLLLHEYRDGAIELHYFTVGAIAMMTAQVAFGAFMYVCNFAHPQPHPLILECNYERCIARVEMPQSFL